MDVRMQLVCLLKSLLYQIRASLALVLMVAGQTERHEFVTASKSQKN